MPPRLYLIRHAHAEDNVDDAARRLSARGHGEIESLVRWLKPSSCFQPEQAWHSPLARARETAERLLSGLGSHAPMFERRELEPEAEPALVAAAIAGATKSLALFGHEPHLSSLASLLVGGSADPVVFIFQKATVLALDPAGRRWAVRWQLGPELFGM